MRRAHVELLAGKLFDARLDRRQLGAELVLHLLQVGHVDGDAFGFHVGEHARQRQLDLMKQVVDAQVAHLGLEARAQVEDHLRAPGCKIRCLFDRHSRGLARGAADAQELLGADERHLEKFARKVFQARVARAGAKQVGGKERAEVKASLAAAQGAQRELGLLGVVTADRAVVKGAGDSVHRVLLRHIEGLRAGRDA